MTQPLLKLRPSDANRWVGCPGSAAMQAAKPRDDSPKHPVTEEGIALHWAVDRILGSWRSDPDSRIRHPHALVASRRELSRRLGDTCPENGVVIDEEMIYGGALYLETCWSIINRDLGGTFGVEEQISAHQWIPGSAGRADFTWWDSARSHLVIVDFKYGYKPVAAIGNQQLLNYALGKWVDTVQTVELIVVQPRGPSASHPVKTWPLNAVEFSQNCQVMIDAAAETRGPDPRLLPGAGCYYCRAAESCEALRAASGGVVDQAFGATNVDLTNPELGHELELLERAESLLKSRLIALRGLGVARIKAGDVVPGFEMATSQGNREWTSVVNLRGLGRLNGCDLMDTRPCSPNQAEARGVPRATIDHFTMRSQRGTTLKAVRRNEARDIFK